MVLATRAMRRTPPQYHHADQKGQRTTHQPGVVTDFREQVAEAVDNRVSLDHVADPE
jgi:hypothetical protein